MTAKCVNIFVLGAGASVDYGLPVWNKLREQLMEYLNANRECLGSPAITNHFIEDLKEIGEDKKYRTVDELISKFSSEADDFFATTQRIFEAVKRIFKSKVMTDSQGWIETFVKKNNLESLLRNADSNYSSVFINFNYDTLLLRGIVTFFSELYESTLNPERAEWNKNTGLEYEAKFEPCAKKIYHPHGVLYLFDRDEIKIGKNTLCYPTTKTCMNTNTFPASPQEIGYHEQDKENAISCHDTRDLFSFSEIKGRINELAGNRQENAEVKLILLGVGPVSLAFNLDKIFEGQTFDVRQIHYTCKEKNKNHIYEQYFDKFQATIRQYNDCKELVERNTFIPFD